MLERKSDLMENGSVNYSLLDIQMTLTQESRRAISFTRISIYLPNLFDVDAQSTAFKESLQ